MCHFRPCRTLVLALVEYLVAKYEEKKAVRQASVKTLNDSAERYVQDGRQETRSYELGAVEEGRVRGNEGWADVKEGPPPGYETAVGSRA
ncbi:hypothetical protein HYALB_00002981 [Hymenoscyphus albidus]|uniref:Uncharacterized protein n=1 Tax=Hymenoscyphus albidus TaxID=595503 RepID=A0A9N9M3L3_9HELO|nr:hypothetical protein HYALB_00002981 [Hymenoscyphus albidus]